MDGSATLTMDASRTTTNWAAASSARASPRLRLSVDVVTQELLFGKRAKRAREAPERSRSGTARRIRNHGSAPGKGGQGGYPHPMRRAAAHVAADPVPV